MPLPDHGLWNNAEDNDGINRNLDFNVHSVPDHYTAADLKTTAGARHVVGAEVDQDHIKGACTGTGRIQIRLSEGETAQMI